MSTPSPQVSRISSLLAPATGRVDDRYGRATRPPSVSSRPERAMIDIGGRLGKLGLPEKP